MDEGVDELELSEAALKLIRAAEELFSTRGVDAVSLREVSIAAGQRNHSAAQYHFRSKEGLIDQLLLRHSLQVQRHWVQEIEALRAENILTIEALVELLVRAVAEKLDDDDGGVAFIQISNQLVSHPTLALLERAAVMTPAPLALSAAMLECIPLPMELLLARMERVASCLYSSLSSFSRSRLFLTREAFLNDLIDSLVALIRTPPTASTLAALAEP